MISVLLQVCSSGRLLSMSVNFVILKEKQPVGKLSMLVHSSISSGTCPQDLSFTRSLFTVSVRSFEMHSGSAVFAWQERGCCVTLLPICMKLRSKLLNANQGRPA